MDIGLQRLAVVGLGLVALVIAIGGVILALDDTALPDALVAIGSAAVGALAGVITGVGGMKALLPQQQQPAPQQQPSAPPPADVPPWMTQTH